MLTVTYVEFALTTRMCRGQSINLSGIVIISPLVMTLTFRLADGRTVDADVKDLVLLQQKGHQRSNTFALGGSKLGCRWIQGTQEDGWLQASQGNQEGQGHCTQPQASRRCRLPPPRPIAWLLV